ncbi:hypothetical protein ACLOJK_034941 [Asimina triloba]
MGCCGRHHGRLARADGRVRGHEVLLIMMELEMVAGSFVWRRRGGRMYACVELGRGCRRDAGGRWLLVGVMHAGFAMVNEHGEDGGCFVGVVGQIWLDMMELVWSDSNQMESGSMARGRRC